MQGQLPQHTEQVRTVMGVLQRLFRDGLLAVYLHGSAVLGGLRSQSDIDLLAIVDSPMTKAQRVRLLGALLDASAPHPAPPGEIRCVELMVFFEAEICSARYPATAEFVYGEWLRTSFERAALPAPVEDPGNTLTLAQARQHSRALFGPPAGTMLPEVSPALVRRATRDALPALLHDLFGDERNVLLTLARMWRTAATSEFVPKDVAAAWAAVSMPEREAQTLSFAREAYLGKLEDVWDERKDAASATADWLRQRILDCV